MITCEGCRAYVLQKNAAAIGFPETKLRLERAANEVCAAMIFAGVCQKQLARREQTVATGTTWPVAELTRLPAPNAI